MPNFLFCILKNLTLFGIKIWKMKNKTLWIALGVIVLGVGGYFLIRKAKFKSQDPQKNDREIKLVSTTK
jgi:Tfp pilus assembly protein PilO